MSFNDKASNFIQNLTNSSLSLIKVLLSSKFKSISKNQTNNRLLIIANGPSINNELSNSANMDGINSMDTMCVNFFHKSDFYLQIKPKYYIIAAPELWLDEVEEIFEKNRLALFKDLNEKTTWKMTLLVPFQAKKYDFWIKTVSSNENITIEYYNLTAIEGFRGISTAIYNQNLGMPRSHNIVGYALMISIWKNYKSIGIMGVEHSWTKTLFVTKENEALLAQPHFYNLNAKAEKMAKGGKDKRKLHEILEKFYLAFKSYFEIKEYANKHNAKIYNLTEDSFIDAFERSNVTDFVHS
jgi:hypothetical protein